jgi:hypothetical protein
MNYTSDFLLSHFAPAARFCQSYNRAETKMSSEEERVLQKGETEESDASDAGDAVDLLKDGEEQEDEDDDDDVDENSTSLNNTHDKSMDLEDVDDISVKSNGDSDASSQDEEDIAEEDDDEDDDDDNDDGPRSEIDSTPKNKPIKAGRTFSSNKKGRVPSVAGLTIPFRTVKKACVK